LAQIASVCKSNGYDVKILDAYALNLSLEKIKEVFLEFSPDVLCVSLWTSTFEGEMMGARFLKNIKKDLLIIVGGPHMDLYAKETLERYPFLDYSVFGEGEKTILELLNALNKERKVEDLKGVVYRKNGRIIQNEAQEIIKDLDEIPFPLIGELPLERYLNIMSGEGTSCIYILTSRGCPFKCKYCVDQQFGRTIRIHSPAYIIKYLKYLVEELNIDKIDFFDDTFTINKKRTITICNKIIEGNLNHRISWSIRTRADTVDEEIIGKLKSAGCYRIGFGVESGSQKILDIMNRGMSKDQIRKSFKLCKKYGLEISANFMIGYPGESKKTYRQTIDFAKELDPTYALFSITIVQPNSDLYRDLQKEGIIVKDFWKDYVSGKLDKIEPKSIRIPGSDYTVEDLDKMQSNAYIRFYFRPKLIVRYLKKKLSPKQFINYARMGMAMLRTYLKNRLGQRVV
jgi:radical SAM superfamily enzyme YgiQ (UPF0313 family)